MSEKEGGEPVRDPVNVEMAGHWTVAEVERSRVLRWLVQWQSRLEWQRFLRWKRITGLPDDLSSIEVGSGYGKFSMLLGLAGARTTLLDYNESALKAALTAHRDLGLQPEGIEADLFDLPGDLRGRFDLVCSFGTLEHFAGEHRGRALQTCNDLLRPGGLHLFTVPNRDGILYRLIFGLRRRLGRVDRGFFEQPYRRAELIRLARQAGIEVLELAGGGTLESDWSWWIVENVRSAGRKLLSTPRPQVPPPSIDGPGDLDLSRELPDPRTRLDRRFSSNLLFVGCKPA